MPPQSTQDPSIEPLGLQVFNLPHIRSQIFSYLFKSDLAKCARLRSSGCLLEVSNHLYRRLDMSLLDHMDKLEGEMKVSVVAEASFKSRIKVYRSSVHIMKSTPDRISVNTLPHVNPDLFTKHPSLACIKIDALGRMLDIQREDGGTFVFQYQGPNDDFVVTEGGSFRSPELAAICSKFPQATLQMIKLQPLAETGYAWAVDHLEQLVDVTTCTLSSGFTSHSDSLTRPGTLQAVIAIFKHLPRIGRLQILFTKSSWLDEAIRVLQACPETVTTLGLITALIPQQKQTHAFEVIGQMHSSGVCEQLEEIYLAGTAEPGKSSLKDKKIGTAECFANLKLVYLTRSVSGPYTREELNAWVAEIVQSCHHSVQVKWEVESAWNTIAGYAGWQAGMDKNRNRISKESLQKAQDWVAWESNFAKALATAREQEHMATRGNEVGWAMLAKEQE